MDYAQLVKLYGAAPEAEKRYSPARCIGARKRRVAGSPDPAHVSTSYVERSNLTMRMGMRRFTRLTNAFSKKIENHLHMLSLFFVHYNFCRVHKSLRMSPAMAAGVSAELRDMKWIVGLIEARARAEAPDDLPQAQEDFKLRHYRIAARLARRRLPRTPATGLPRLPVSPSLRAVPTTPADRNGCIRRLLPRSTRPSPNLRRVGVHIFTFEAAQASLAFGPQGRSTAQGGLCHRASLPPVTRQDRLSATRSNRQLSGWILPPLVLRAVGAY